MSDNQLTLEEKIIIQDIRTAAAVEIATFADICALLKIIDRLTSPRQTSIVTENEEPLATTRERELAADAAMQNLRKRNQ